MLHSVGKGYFLPWSHRAACMSIPWLLSFLFYRLLLRWSECVYKENWNDNVSFILTFLATFCAIHMGIQYRYKNMLSCMHEHMFMRTWNKLLLPICPCFLLLIINGMWVCRYKLFELRLINGGVLTRRSVQWNIWNRWPRVIISIMQKEIKP